MFPSNQALLHVSLVLPKFSFRQATSVAEGLEEDFLI